MQSLIILPPWPGHDPLTSHNLWLVNLEPCTLHSSPPTPPNPTLLVGGGKDYQCKLQRVRTSTSIIGVPDAASNCYLHKGSPFIVYIQEVPSAAALVQVTIGHSNGACACPDPL